MCGSFYFHEVSGDPRFQEEIAKILDQIQGASSAIGQGDAHHKRLVDKMNRLQEQGLVKAHFYKKLKIDPSDYYKWQVGKSVSPGIKTRLEEAIEKLAE